VAVIALGDLGMPRPALVESLTLYWLDPVPERAKERRRCPRRVRKTDSRRCRVPECPVSRLRSGGKESRCLRRCGRAGTRQDPCISSASIALLADPIPEVRGRAASALGEQEGRTIM